MSPGEAAKVIGITRQSVLDAVKRGAIRGRRSTVRNAFGRAPWILDADSVMEYARRNATPERLRSVLEQIAACFTPFEVDEVKIARLLREQGIEVPEVSSEET